VSTSRIAGLARHAFLLTALAGAGQLFAKTVTVSTTDNNTSICLIEGDTLVVNLTSSAPIAAAYRWKLQSEKPIPLTLERQFEAPGAEKDTKVQTFHFNAASPGQTTLTFRWDLAALLDGPRDPAQTFSVQVSVASGAPASMVLIGTFKGVTACADCTGIQTELRLYAKGKFDFTDNIYVSTRTYLGGRNGAQSFTDRGAWFMMKGDAVDPNATVYELNPDQPQYFLVQPGGAALTQLDGQMKPIDAPLQYQTILKRVE
jgi:copper homeostasis protein (lipoprotein)